MNTPAIVAQVLDKIPIHYWTRRIFDLPILLKWSRIPRGASILEVGCNKGETARYLSAKLKCLNYIAIDIDPQRVARAESEADNPTNLIFQRADVCKLPFEDESFDAVIMIDLLHHLEDWRKAIREVHRVLKYGGVLLMRDYSIETFTMPGMGFVLQQLFNHPYHHMYDQIELLTYLRKNGFVMTHQNDMPWLLIFSAVKKLAGKKHH